MLRSSAVVSFYTALSRVLGFVREILMAVFFGTSLAKSAFDIAFRVPNLFRRLFGEGALSAAFIPVFADTLETEGKESANALAGRVFTLLGTVLLIVVVAVVVAVTVIAGTRIPGSKALAVLDLLIIMFPYMFFICLVALCMGVLNTFKRFAIPAFTPVLLNVVWILSLLFMCPRFGDEASEQIYGVAWGVLIAGVLQLGIQIPALLRTGLRPRLSFDWTDPRVRRIAALMGPAALGMGVLQLNVLVDSVLAMLVGKWAPATLTYAERLIYLPLGVFATAMGTVLLPEFSRSSSKGNTEQIRRTMGVAFRSLFLIMIPAAAGLVVLSAPIIELAFRWEGGAFGAESVVLTSRVLVLYAPGLIAFGAFKVLAPAFYSVKDTITPVKVGVHVVVLNFLLNIVFIATWPEGYKHAGLALATVIASGTNCICLGMIFHRRIGSPGWKVIFARSCRMVLAALLMALGAFYSHRALYRHLGGVDLPEKIIQVLAVGTGVAAGIGVYALLIRVLCAEEYGWLVAAVRKRRS